MRSHVRPALAELVGTFVFFFIGAGSIVVDSYTHGAVGLLGIALAHGLILSIMVSAFGAISGGHFNPAVTIGLWVAKKVTAPTVVLYIIAQLIGGALAGFLLRGIFPAAVWMPSHLGTPALTAGFTPLAGVALEAVLTFFLLLAVLGTAVDSMAPKIGGFGIGLTVAVDILVGGPITGAAMNPARVFGPGLAAGFWENHWIYWVGPIAGACLASWLYTRFLSKTI
jgi:MIP family channel proteins